MNYILIFLLSCSSFAFSENAQHAWWDNCLNKTVSLDTFAQWLGDTQAPSRCAMRKQIQAKGYASILDIPCGLCIDYFGIKKSGIAVAYTGVDASALLVNRAKEMQINAIQGNIETIPFSYSQFDLVFARHILEHLAYYEKAVCELIRVAKKEVLIVFFIKPIEKSDAIIYGEVSGSFLYHNIYNRQKFEDFIRSHPRVHSLEWETVNEQEEIAHIYLKGC